jgi:predicted 3-demethylubiquinone-9 3-methyltransferase (glyoxalase superfamily)
MFQILEELLKKLEVEHIVWCNDKNGYYYQVSLLEIKQSKDECD